MSDTRRVPEPPRAGEFTAISLDIELQPVDAGDLPVQFVQVLPLGHVKIRDSRGDFEVGKIALLNILRTFGMERVDMAVDYNHGMYYGDNAKAAGWGESMKAVVPAEWANLLMPLLENDEEIDMSRIEVVETENEGETGLFVKVRWTEEAAELIRKREYRYISPVVVFNSKNDPDYIWNVAITNTPAIDGMLPMAASILGATRPDAEAGGESAASEGYSEGEENARSLLVWFKGIMSRFDAVADLEEPGDEPLSSVRESEENTAATTVLQEGDIDMKETLMKIAELFGVSLETEDEAEVLALFEGIKKSNDEIVIDLTEKLNELTEKLEALEEAITARDEKLEEHAQTEREHAVDAAINSGVITKARRDWALENFSAFESFVGTDAEGDEKQGPNTKTLVAEAKNNTDDLTDPELAKVQAIREIQKEEGCSYSAASVIFEARQ